MIMLAFSGSRTTCDTNPLFTGAGFVYLTPIFCYSKAMNKKKIFLWTLYDFANSIAIVTFFLYFSQWLVVDHGVSDFWFNMLFVGGTILLIITAPVAGAIADKLKVRMPFLIWISVLFFISLLVTSFAAVLSDSKTAIFIAAMGYMFANYFYQFSFNFYNPLLDDLAPPEKQGKISGLGQAANWIGQVGGLFITLPFAAGTIYLFGQHGRPQTFLPATVLFFILALPMLIFFKEPKRSREPQPISIRQEYKEFIRNFVTLCKVPGVGWYLLGYFFFNDAMLTVLNNIPIYLEQVFHISDNTKSLFAAAVLVTAAIGAYLGGVIADKIGLKKSLLFILIAWAVIFPLVSCQHFFGSL
jgi:MFS transporter, UMF1 family